MKAKKILSACVVFAAIAMNAAALEITGKVSMEGNIVKETQTKDGNPKVDTFNLDPIDDKSKNGIEVDFDGGLAGAHFELFYLIQGTAAAENGWSVSARKTHLWFKPVDALKIRIGYVGDDTFFCERVNNERVGNPFRNDMRGSNLSITVPKYITNADVDEMGFSVAVTPVENLMISAAVAPGVGNAGISKNGTDSTDYTQWGLGTKYSFNNGLMLQAAYRDNGKDSWKVIRFGAGYENKTVYTFLQPVLGLEYIPSKDAYEMNGFCLDMYGEYNLSAWKFIAHLPVTIRTTGKSSDPSYMEGLVQVKYNIGYLGLLENFTPYVKVETAEAMLFDDAADSLGLKIQPGTEFAVGKCNVDLGARVTVHTEKEDSAKATWAIPFSCSMKF